MMKKTLLAFAFVATSLLVSCQGQIEPSNQKGGNDGAKVFTASIDNALTRTTLGDATGNPATYPVNWTSGDEVTINGVTYTVTPDGTDATKSTLTKNDSGAADPTGTFNAFYPKGIQLDATAGGTLPTSQTYTDGAISSLPMYATATGTSLTFKNICGVLAVTIPSGTTVSKIVVSSSDKALSGAFTVKEKTSGKGDYYAELTQEAQSAKANFTLNLSSAVTLEAAATYYIPVPAQEYGDLSVIVYADATKAPTKYMATKNPSITIDANTIYPLAYAPNVVQLWSGGPYWATTNIGADKPEAYGQYFAWGYTTGYTHDGSAWTDGANTITFDDKNGFSDYEDHTYSDMAAANWGAGWSVPTDAQLKTLVNKDESNKSSVDFVAEGVQGIRITGTESGYTSNSIFLPAAGFGDGSSREKAVVNGYFWSSVQDDDDSCCAYYLGFFLPNENSGMGTYDKYSGLSVRPVRSSL